MLIKLIKLKNEKETVDLKESMRDKLQRGAYVINAKKFGLKFADRFCLT